MMSSSCWIWAQFSWWILLKFIIRYGICNVQNSEWLVDQKSAREQTRFCEFRGRLVALLCTTEEYFTKFLPISQILLAESIYKILSLIVRGPSYLGLTMSISRLLASWLLTSPGHQQSWYWLSGICRFWPFSGKDFKYLCHINVE